MCLQILCHFYQIDVVYVQNLSKVPKIKLIVAFHWNTPFIMYPVLYTCDWNLQSINKFIFFFAQKNPSYCVSDLISPEIIIIKSSLGWIDTSRCRREHLLSKWGPGLNPQYWGEDIWITAILIELDYRLFKWTLLFSYLCLFFCDIFG
jgi:hypothetical protein